MSIHLIFVSEHSAIPMTSHTDSTQCQKDSSCSSTEIKLDQKFWSVHCVILKTVLVYFVNICPHHKDNIKQNVAVPSVMRCGAQPTHWPGSWHTD